MWAGVEPQPKQYNMTYVKIMQQIVELLGSNGIDVLLDMHQDVLSSRTGSYDGIPGWLYDRFPAPQHACKFVVTVSAFREKNGGVRSFRSVATEKSTDQLVRRVRENAELAEVFTALHRYLAQAVSVGFQNLYDNVAGATESMADFWRFVATNFQQYSNILG